MACEINKIFNNVSIKKDSALQQAISIFSNSEKSIREKETALNAALSTTLKERNSLLEAAGASKLPALQLDFIPLSMTDEEIELTLRQIKSAGDTIVNADTVVIGDMKRTNFTATSKHLSNLLSFSRTKLNKFYAKSLTLAEYLTTHEGLKELEQANEADKAVISEINGLSSRLASLFKGSNSKPPLMNFMTNRGFNAVFNERKGSGNQSRPLQPKELRQDVLAYLMSGTKLSDLTIDPLVLDAVSIAVYNWQATVSLGTLSNTDADINRMLGRNTSTEVTDTEREGLSDIVLQAQVIDSIGTDVFNLLGFKAKNNEIDGAFSEKMKVALGQLALSFMMHDGYIRQDPVEKTILEGFTGVGTEIPMDQDPSQNIVMFLKVLNKDKATALNAQHRETSIVSKLLGAKEYRSFPEKKIVRKVVSFMRRTLQKVPEKTKKVLKKLQKDPWKIKTNFSNKFFSMDENTYKEILGYKTEAQIEALHITQRIKAEAHNNKIQRSIDNFMDFQSQLKSPNASFFMKYFVSRNGRIFIDNNTLNPLDDNMMRHLIGLDSFNLEVNTPELLEQFKLAVVQNFGGDIDKQSPEDSFQEFEDIFKNNAEAIDAIAADNLSEESQKIVLQALIKPDGSSRGVGAFEALNALAVYSKAIEGQTELTALSGLAFTPFVTNIAIETDAVTSGVAIGMMQSLTGSVDDRAAIGVSNDSTFSDYPTWRGQLKNYDLYQKLAVSWSSFVELYKKSGLKSAPVILAIESLVGSFYEDSSSLISDTGRLYSKDPLMLTNYGASIEKAKVSFSNTVLEKFYSELAAANNNPETLATLENLYNKITNNQAPLNPQTEAKNFVLNSTQKKLFLEAVQQTYGLALEQALTERLGSFMVYRNYINQSFEIMFALFNSKFTAEIANQTLLKERNLSLEEVEAIIESIRNTMPVIKGPLSDGLDDGIAAIKGGIKRQYDSGHKNQQQYSGNLPNGTKSSSLTNYSTAYEFSTPGVSGAVVNIHNLDSAIQQAMLTTVSAISIHDAGIHSLATVEEGTKSYNEAFLQFTTQTYNLLKEVDASLVSVGMAYKKAKPNSIVLPKRPESILVDQYNKLINDTKDAQSVVNKLFSKKVINVIRETPDGFKTEKTSFAEFRTLYKRALLELEAKRKTFIEDNPVITVANAAHTPGGNKVVLQGILKLSEEQELENLIDSAFSTIKGSSSRTVDFDNFVTLMSATVNATNIKTVFNAIASIGTKKDSLAHTARLEELMDNFVKLQGSIDLKVGETTDITFGAQRTFEDGSQDIHILGSASTVNNNAQLSAQEVYVHELIHAVTENAIDSNPRLRSALKRLYTQAEKVFTYKDFLPEGEKKPSKEEITTAKETYDYIFNSTRIEEVKVTDPNTGHITTKKINPYLHEFVAYGLSNERMVKKLASIKTKQKTKTEKTNTLWDKLKNWFHDAIINISNRIVKVNNLSGDVALRRLVDQMMTTNEKNKYGFLRIFESLDGVNEKTLGLLNKFIFAPAHKYNISDNKPTTKVGRTVGTLVSLLDPKIYGALGKAIKQISFNIALTERSFITKLVREMQGLTENNSVWHSMLRISKKTIDQARMHEADNVIKQLNDSLHTKLTKEESAAVYKSFMKTDITALLTTVEPDKYTPDNLMQILRDPASLAIFIQDVETQLLSTEFGGKKDGSNSWYYIHQARGLGNLMAKGDDFVSGQMRNAFNIASLNNVSVEAQGDIAKAELLIDELATLYSLLATSQKEKDLAADVYARENEVDGKVNGIAALFNLQVLAKKQSLEKLFHGNKALTAKGYTKENFDPNIDIKVGDKKQKTIEQMSKAGYRLVKDTKLRMDTNDNTEPRYLYVNKSASNSPWVKTIASLTSRQANGTTLEDIYTTHVTDGTYFDAQTKTRQIKKATASDIKAQFTSKGFKTKGIALVPVVNESGSTASYRYVMTDFAKDTILNRDNRFDYSLGRTFGSIVDKVNSVKVNKQVLLIAKGQFDAQFLQDQSAFVDISDTSPDEELREMYRLMPKEMKKDMEDIWGKGNPVMIRKEFVNLIFGFRKLRLTDQQNLVGAGFRNMNEGLTWILQNSFFPDAPNVDIGKIWTEVVDIAKSNIVVKTGVILLPNFISNNILLWVKGVNTQNIAKYQSEAVIELDKYSKAVSRRDIVKRIIASDKALTKIKLKKLQVELARLETDISENVVSELLDEGIFQSIIEDVNFEEDIYSSKAKLGDKVQQIANRYLPDFATSTYKHLYLTQDTKPYQLLLKATQVSDFMARYALYRTRISAIPKRLKTKEAKENYRRQILNEIIETFVNYDVPTSREMQWVNDVGLLMFTKFYFRIQKIIFKQFKEKPASALSILLLDDLFGNMDDITDTSIFYMGLFNRFNTPFDILDQTLVVPAGELVGM